MLELPPRTRRIPAGASADLHTVGTTSAYAENTQLCSKLFESHWNYLRVRGEYIIKPFIGNCAMELPPRTRRIREHKAFDYFKVGTTSAYAENTSAVSAAASGVWNYLRVRGEYRVMSWSTKATWELPPRTRRIPDCGASGGGDAGTTSAYAENTLNELGLL